MSQAHDARTPIAATTCALTVRADLQTVKRAARSGYQWLVKDPISLRYFQLSEVEYALLRMMNGTTTLAQLKEAIERRFPPRIVTFEQLQTLVHRFFELGLVYGDGGAQTAAAQKARRSQRRGRWLGQLANPLFIKFPGVDPERTLEWLVRGVRWAFRPVVLLACLAFVGTAIVLAAMEFEAIRAELPTAEQLFQGGNFAWLVVALAISKGLHELGHAVACKHFGGECHEIGPALFFFTPCLYCDATDAWMIPSTWKRAAVGAAGMGVELMLASVCLLIWRLSEPGLIHFLCLNIVVVCTASTLLFNGNPLLRFDGYYIFSDILEIPNLWQASQAALTRILQVHALGFRDATVPRPSHSQSLLLAYGVASMAYRFVPTLGIAVFLLKGLRPYGLQVVGNSLLGLTLVGMAALPIWRTLRFLRRPDVWRRMNASRAATTLGLVLFFVAAVLFLPVPHRVLAPLVLELRGADRLYVTVPGIIDRVYTRPGDRVTAGQPIAKLTNLDIDREISKLAGERDRMRLHVQNLQRRQGRDQDAADAIPAARAAVADLEERLRRRRLDRRRLVLTAHQSGVFAPPPGVPVPPLVNDDLPNWAGLPCDELNVGCFLEVGTLVGLVGDPDHIDALLIVGQSQIEYVRPGQRVEIKLNQRRAETLVGTISQVAQIGVEDVPLVLSHKSGGEVATVSSESGNERPIRVAYQVRVQVDSENLRILPGSVGRARVAVGSEPLGQRIARLVRQTLKF